MSLFGSGKSGKTPDTKVSFANTGDGETTLLVNGVPYGKVTAGQTPNEDSMLVNSGLSEQQRAEALVGLVQARFGKSPQEVAKTIDDFRKWKNK